MSYKSINALMRHLRTDCGIDINGSTQKRQLINTGYYHGYKGYRFFKTSSNRLPFTSYNELYATIQYDLELKSLIYGKIIYIETAVKNIALECILKNINSESIQDMYDKAINSYNNAPNTISSVERKKFQQNKLNLQKTIQHILASAYKKNNPKIAHYYNNIGYSDVPLWSLFEILMMGDFGFLLSCLKFDIREDISKKLNLNLSCDTDRELIFKYIYTLKDLRNAIAHNSVVFDARFCNTKITNAMKQCLILDIGLPYINFKTIGDYIILMCYYMKNLKVPKKEITSFIRKFEKLTDEYRGKVNSSVENIVIHPDLNTRINILKNYL